MKNCGLLMRIFFWQCVREHECVHAVCVCVLDGVLVSSALLLIDYHVWSPARQTKSALQEETESACDQRQESEAQKES